jgi:predicted P-loop ATPase
MEAIRRDNALTDIAGRLGVALRKNGSEWIACCPFHSEKTESFTVFTGKDRVQRFHCFGCGANGDVIDFVRERTGYSVPQACEFLGGTRGAPENMREAAPAEPASDPYEGYKILLPPPGAPEIVAGKRTPELLNPKRVVDGKPRVVTYMPSDVYPYRTRDGRLIGYVLRVEIEGGRKITPAILWMRKGDWSGWSHGSIPEPRPLFRLPELLAEQGRQVLLVEGEKCAKRAAAAFAGKVEVVTWAGGSKAYEKTDWRALKGRRVVIWPDNDKAGDDAIFGRSYQGQWHRGIAEILADIGAIEIKIVTPPGKDRKDGWDVDDALEEMPAADALKWAKGRTVAYDPQVIEERKAAAIEAEPQREERRQEEPVEQRRPTEQAKPDQSEKEAKKEKKKPRRAESGNIVSLYGDPIPLSNDDRDLDDFRAHLVMTGGDEPKMDPKATANQYWQLAGSPKTRGLFAWNDVLSVPMLTRLPPWEGGDPDTFRPRPMNDSDELFIRHMLEHLRLKPTKTDLSDTIKTVARRKRVNPVRDYLAGLRWDGEPRLFGGVSSGGDNIPPAAVEYFNAPDRSIFAAFVARWFISAVARVMRPGCKVDTMLILESGQGFMKSSAIKLLATIDGHAYFVDDVGDIQDRKSILQLDTSWIVEISELTGFSKKSNEPVKAWLSRQIDTFVPPYGRHPEDRPRKYVIAGTVNPLGSGYLKDPSGARRMWPVPVTAEIDLAKLGGAKDQLWAEAVHYFAAGEQWWLTEPEVAQAKVVTDDRYQDDPWKAELEFHLSGISSTDMKDAHKLLSIPSHQQTQFTSERIGSVLRSIGFERRKGRSDLTRKVAWIWVRAGSEFEQDDSEGF